jgi:hypothetical protein
MSSILQHTTSLVLGEKRVPLHPENYRPGLLLAFFIALAVVCAIIAFAANELGFRVVMGALALVMVVIGVMLRMWSDSVVEQIVRVEARASASASGLRFVPSLGARLAYPLIAIFTMLPAAVALACEASGLALPFGNGIGRWGVYLLGLGGLVWCVQQLWQLRTLLGLGLDATGVHGVRGSAHAEMAWEALEGVSVSPGKRAKLVLLRAGGMPVIIEPRRIGSDPHAVAAVVGHYLRHPADREILSDPRAAIRRVEDLNSTTPSRGA